jgi:two-component system nitrogen regulation response regulator GlnG
VLTQHFLHVSAVQLGVESKRISEAALAALCAFNFPGNVRQLENICHWLMVMAPAQMIEPKDLPPEVTEGLAIGAEGQLPSRVGNSASGLPIGTQASAVAAPVVQALSNVAASPAGQSDSVSAGITSSLGVAGGTGLGRSGVDDPEHLESSVDTSPAGAPNLAPGPSMQPPRSAWEAGVEAEAQTLLANGKSEVWDVLTRRFEAQLIITALAHTKGRRIEAAQKLGIGRNTITRKIQELGLDD